MQHLFTLSVALCVENFVANGPRLTKYLSHIHLW